MKTLLCLFPCLLFLLTTSQTVCAESEWKLIIDKNDVKVYTRSFPDSQIDEFKGVAVVNARMEVIGEVLRNVADHPKWMDRCKETRIVKNLKDGSVICHITTKIPWPVSTRDVVIRQSVDVSMDEDKGTIILSINFRAIDDPAVPPRDGIIRIKDLTGRYVLEYIDREHTNVIFHTKTNPIGSLPAFMANYGSRSVPYNTLIGLKKEVKKPKYLSVVKDAGHMNKENLLITKMILKSQLKKHVRDENLINAMVDDKLVKQILKGKELTKKEVAKLIVESQLRKRTKDKEIIDDIINNEELIQKIIKDKELTEKEVVELIMETRRKNINEEKQ